VCNEEHGKKQHGEVGDVSFLGLLGIGVLCVADESGIKIGSVDERQPSIEGLEIGINHALKIFLAHPIGNSPRLNRDLVLDFYAAP
jgi:hypothetical protein